MSPVIRIPDSIYKRLEAYAVGFDNPGNVIERLLNFWDENHRKGSKTPTEIPPKPSIITVSGEIRDLNPDNPGDLTFARIIEGCFGAEKVTNWKRLVCVAHKCAMGYFASFDELRRITRSNITEAIREDSGFHHCSEIEMSIQGENANKSWDNAFHLAKQINTPKRGVKSTLDSCKKPT